MSGPAQQPRSTGYRAFWAIVWGVVTWIVGSVVLAVLWDSVIHGDPNVSGLGAIAAVIGVVVGVLVYQRVR